MRQKNGMMVGVMSMVALTMASISLADFSADQQYAKTLRPTVNQAITAYPANQNVPGYSNHPEEANAYQGVTQTTTPIDQQANAVDNQSGSQANDAGAGNTVATSFTTRQRDTLDPQSQMIQNGQAIEQDSYHMTHGISDDQVNCQASGMCGGDDLFCLNGDCAPHTPSQTSQQDFAQSTTDLAAANGAGQDVGNQQPPNSQTIHIFSGQAMQLSKDGCRLF